MTLIVTILTKNEGRHIGDCLKSIQGLTDFITLEDSYSDDGTVETAQALGAKIFQSKFVNFAVARNKALADAKALGGEWLFFVDADERITPELAREVRQVIQDESYAGWWVPRYNMMWGHQMQGGGWYPDYQLRLMKIDRASYNPEREVHETVILEGQAGYLREHLIHYNYDSLAQFRRKQSRYIDFEAKILKDKGIRAKPWTYLTMPLREFRRRYFQLNGYRDGWVGFQVCGLMSWYTFITYLRLRKLHMAG